MAAILHLVCVQHERPGVDDALGRVRAGLLRQAVRQLGAALAGQEAGLARVVLGLAGDVDGGVGRRVLAGVGDELLDLGVGRAGVREDADLHPHRVGLAVLRRLLVKLLPGGRVGAGPRLHTHE